MSFFQNLLGSAANTMMHSNLGGLNMNVAGNAVSTLLVKSGDSVVFVAKTLGFLPNEKTTLTYLHEQAKAAGVAEKTEELVHDLNALAVLWKKMNTSDWEEFIVEVKAEVDLAPWQSILDAATKHKHYAHALQALVELKFPKLYLLRAIALGITATKEDTLNRIKLNTFRTFFLRTALPGTEYDKYIDYYVIATSEKDSLDEMLNGQTSKLKFAFDSIVNVASVKLASHFESEFHKLIEEKFNFAKSQSGS